ncbi:uncharacterized protein M421DRAFT_5474 [Didymella exigua CBS 183.55]|uniref:Uncharacterized protein n=1 Tax=Didymella exigua CBS 183.55 TaxID=1150837 RepID=A0A6A5RN46_9PLEO|nr:uncharacterized protein M421DRAFT_5474 [Didymella exigua CBS 183.55]KAF1928434.1 hypothetical protein M421DRAFT_5474 [Didymella exigua CBS 183.55]
MPPVSMPSSPIPPHESNWYNPKAGSGRSLPNAGIASCLGPALISNLSTPRAQSSSTLRDGTPYNSIPLGIADTDSTRVPSVHSGQHLFQYRWICKPTRYHRLCLFVARILRTIFKRNPALVNIPPQPSAPSLDDYTECTDSTEHLPTWVLPSEATLYAIFNSSLAADLILSPERFRYPECFCSYILYHVESMLRIDVTRDKPSDNFELQQAMERIFSDSFAEQVTKEIFAPLKRARHVMDNAPVELLAVVSEINANFVRNFNGHLAETT